MSGFGLTLEPVLGSDIDVLVPMACRIAGQIGLAYVIFEANGKRYTCYDNGTAQRWSSEGKAEGRDTFDGVTWAHHPPISA